MALFLNFFGCFYVFIIFIVIATLFSGQSFSSRTTNTNLINVVNFGAKPNGAVDSTKAFSDAWTAACGTADSAVIYVPKGRYLLGPTRFDGVGCRSTDITLRIDGTLVGPKDYRVLGKEQDWVSFVGVNGVSIVGGRFDANGEALWACKAAGGDCPLGATTIRFMKSNKIRIQGLLSLNSQMFHVAIDRSQNVKIEDVQILAAGESPNTDGIHVQRSINVAITNASIKTGDDCISIGPGAKDLWVEQVTCGPGHGISIGSLARDEEEEGVQNVTVKRAVMVQTDNGLRIKSWPRKSNGFVRRVRFLGAIMVRVANPIIIDQHYCPGPSTCHPQESSGIRINDVIYSGIMGTSATKIAVKMDCSQLFGCKGVRMRSINLTYDGGAAQTSCSNVAGTELGLIAPKGCLS